MTQRHKMVSPHLWCSLPVHTYFTLQYEQSCTCWLAQELKFHKEAMKKLGKKRKVRC